MLIWLHMFLQVNVTSIIQNDAKNVHLCSPIWSFGYPIMTTTFASSAFAGMKGMTNIITEFPVFSLSLSVPFSLSLSQGQPLLSFSQFCNFAFFFCSSSDIWTLQAKPICPLLIFVNLHFTEKEKQVFLLLSRHKGDRGSGEKQKDTEFHPVLVNTLGIFFFKGVINWPLIHNNIDG